MVPNLITFSFISKPSTFFLFFDDGDEGYRVFRPSVHFFEKECLPSYVISDEKVTLFRSKTHATSNYSSSSGFYRLPMKLHEDNVFSGVCVCLSVQRGGDPM